MRVATDGICDHQQRLREALASYYEGIEDGHTPDPRALIDGHPDLADELAEFFAIQDHLHHLAAPIRDLIVVPARSLPADGEATDSSPLDGRKSIGEYDLDCELARGGVGIVYRARQRSLNRPGRRQGAPGRRQRDPGRRPPIPPGGRDGGQPRPPQHRPDLRGRRGGGLQLLQHEADRGRQPGGPRRGVRRRYPPRRQADV